MKACELEQHLKNGAYIIAAFGNIYLHQLDKKSQVIHKNIFRSLIRRGLLYETCIECGASEFRLKTINNNVDFQTRSKKLEKALMQSCAILGAATKKDPEKIYNKILKYYGID
jgi:hypothetical protein